jgi:Protein of unknown function (DUF2934)
LTTNPLEMTPEREARIRERAYQLWEEDGRPVGRDAEFWERAEELIGMEENADAALRPNPLAHPTREENPVEEAEIQENYGDFPDRFTDQGERPQTPRARSKWGA